METELNQPKKYNPTDTRNADYLEQLYDGKVKFIEELDRFVLLSDNGWQIQLKEPFNLTRRLIDQLHDDLRNCEDNQERTTLIRNIDLCEKTGIQRNILALLKSLTAIKLVEFDKDPYEINCRNGIINLQSRSFRPRDEQSFFLKKANVNYNPDATCPTWNRAVPKIFLGNEELINYVQIALGYSMLGITKEDCFFICHGPTGRNGKRILLETVLGVLGRGDYGEMFSFDSFLQKTTNTTARGLEAKGLLKGHRFVISSEVNEGTTFDAAIMKTLTGSDIVRGTKLFHGSTSFDATHTLWLACNHLPRINAADDALWPRVKMIPFNHKFRPNYDMDTNLFDSLKTEYDGIFNWLLAGAYKYIENGLPKEPLLSCSISKHLSVDPLCIFFY